jgi:transcriptional regulator with XRE-family HTH domain
MKLQKLIAEIDRKRKLKGLNDTELSKIGGVKHTSVGDWIKRGVYPKTIPGISAIFKICDFLKINISEFIDMDSIDGRLTFLCVSNQVPQYKLCEASGIGLNLISQWTNGTTPRKLESIKKLADYCGVTPEWILYGDKKEPRNGLIDLPVSQPQPTKIPIFKAKPKTTVSDFVRCDNGSIVEIQSGKVFTESQFNELFEVVL